MTSKDDLLVFDIYGRILTGSKNVYEAKTPKRIKLPNWRNLLNM